MRSEELWNLCFILETIGRALRAVTDEGDERMLIHPWSPKSLPRGGGGRRWSRQVNRMQLLNVTYEA